MIVVCYTDASYDSERKVAACGYVILTRGRMIKHTVVLAENVASAIDGEFFAATLALHEAYLQKEVSQIILNTDCLTVLNFKNGYKARQKQMAADYHETLMLLKEERIALKINHVRAHKDDHYNNKVDMSCRKNLRNFIRRNY